MTRAKQRTTVVLRFKTNAARDYFMGQLSDGWGENVCELDWPSSRSFKHCEEFDVSVSHPDGHEVLTEDDASHLRRDGQ